MAEILRVTPVNDKIGQRAAAIDIVRVEEAGLNALQTQRQLFYDGWLLRLSPGTAKRARSVNPHFGSDAAAGREDRVLRKRPTSATRSRRSSG
jgi:hypothetical protein